MFLNPHGKLTMMRTFQRQPTSTVALATRQSLSVKKVIRWQRRTNRRCNPCYAVSCDIIMWWLMWLGLWHVNRVIEYLHHVQCIELDWFLSGCWILQCIMCSLILVIVHYILIIQCYIVELSYLTNLVFCHIDVANLLCYCLIRLAYTKIVSFIKSSSETSKIFLCMTKA